MKSQFLAILVLCLTIGTIKALMCHTCVDYRPWPALNLTAEVKGPLSLCRQGADPSFLFLRKCNESQVCAQFFFDGLYADQYIRYAARGCVDPDIFGDEEWQDENMNTCLSGPLDLHPIYPIGPADIYASFCNETACDSCKNGGTVSASQESLVTIVNSMKIPQQ